MAVRDVSTAAATAVLGYDLLRDASDIKTSSVDRNLKAAALTGSAAADDTAVDVFVGGVRVAILKNVTTGNPTNDHIQPLGVFAPAGAPISAIVTDAPVTSPIILRIIVDDLE